MSQSPNQSNNQQDNSMQVLKQHGGNIVTVIMLVLAAFFGWQYWQNKGASVDTQASDQFSSIQNLNNQVIAAQQNPNKTEQMTKLLAESQTQLTSSIDELVANHGGSIYAWQALMIKARTQMDSNDYANAAQTLKLALDNKAIDDGLKAMTSLRYAHALLADGKTDEAEAAANVEMPDAFIGSKQELLGDVYLAKGDKAAAKEAYKKAWDLLAERTENRSVLMLKMESLGMAVQPVEQPSLVTIPNSTEPSTTP